jgi:hypothetical protein
MRTRTRHYRHAYQPPRDIIIIIIIIIIIKFETIGYNWFIQSNE